MKKFHLHIKYDLLICLYDWLRECIASINPQSNKYSRLVASVLFKVVEKIHKHTLLSFRGELKLSFQPHEALALSGAIQARTLDYTQQFDVFLIKLLAQIDKQYS